MGFLSKVFGGSESSSKMKALKLTNKAFHLVEQGQYYQAIDLLEQATRLDPQCGDAYNELAFIYGRIRGDLDRAEEYAQRAVECNPSNPKFYNAINGIQLARAKQLKTRPEIRQSMSQRLQVIQLSIDRNPSYPPLYLTKAVTLALNGEPEQVWEAELKRAEELYLQSNISAAGLPLTTDLIKDIITRNRNQCLEMSSYLKSIPED